MINFKLKTLLISSTKDQGFALILALVAGAVMILATTATIFTLQKENIIQFTEGETSRGLNAAQRGFYRYLKLINSNKFIAQHPACATTWNSSGVCQDSGTAQSWAQAQNIPGISPACPSADATAIKNFTNRDWQDLDPSNSTLGQYRLIDYTFNPNEQPPGSGEYKPFGTLTVEGRVNQKGSGSGATGVVNTATARVKQDIPLQPGLPGVPAIGVSLGVNFNGLNPAVWIGNGSATAVGTLKVNGNILFSKTDCSIPTGGGNPDFSNATSIIGDPRTLSGTTPNVPTPPLPGVLNNITNAQLTAAGTLPRAGDTPDPATNYYHYLVQDQLNLGGKPLNIQETTKVILYVQGNITIDGNVNQNQPANSSGHLEIYGNSITGAGNKYGCAAGVTCPTTGITFGGDVDVKGFIHAPAATVKQNLTPTVDLTGAIWVNNWNTPNSTITITPDNNYFNYTTIRNMNTANQRLVEPILSPPSSWETEEVQ
jgi:hypothetical protein